MNLGEFVEKAVLAQDLLVDNREVLKLVEGPDHLHSTETDLPEDIQEILMMGRGEEWTERELKLSCKRWMQSQGLVGGSFEMYFCSPIADIRLLRCVQGVIPPIWPVESMLIFPMIDFSVIENIARRFINTTRVDGNVYQVNIENGEGTRYLSLSSSMEQRIREILMVGKYPTLKDEEVAEKDSILINALLKARV